MRRIDRKITDEAIINSILENTLFCSLSLNTPDGTPYTLPLSYGFAKEKENLTLYFHCAKEGYKIDLLKEDPRASFCIAHQGDLIKAETPCGYSTYFHSILGKGNLRIVTESGEKDLAICSIMRHYDKEVPLLFSEAMLSSITILALDVTSSSTKGKMA